MVILCFERLYPKQKCYSPKIKHFASPKKNLGWLLELDRCFGTPIYIGRYNHVADVSYRQNSADIYRQYLLIKVLFCMERSVTQVATWSLTLID